MSEPERAIVAAEEQFFNECNTERGGNLHYDSRYMVLNSCWVVPVIVVLTKADAMEGQAIGRLREQGMSMRDAMQNAGSLAPQILSEVRTKIESKLNGCKYPPKTYLSLSGELSSSGPLYQLC